MKQHVSYIIYILEDTLITATLKCWFLQFHESTISMFLALLVHSVQYVCCFFISFQRGSTWRWFMSEGRAGHRGRGILPDDHVTAFRPLRCSLGQLNRSLTCIVANPEVNVALSSTEDKLRGSSAAARGDDQTSRCSDDEPDSLSMPMVTQLSWRHGAIWDGNILWCYG